MWFREFQWFVCNLYDLYLCEIMRELTNYNERFDVKRPGNVLGDLDRWAMGGTMLKAKMKMNDHRMW